MHLIVGSAVYHADEEPCGHVCVFHESHDISTGTARPVSPSRKATRFQQRCCVCCGRTLEWYRVTTETRHLDRLGQLGEFEQWCRVRAAGAPVTRMVASGASSASSSSLSPCSPPPAVAARLTSLASTFTVPSKKGAQSAAAAKQTASSLLTVRLASAAWTRVPFACVHIMAASSHETASVQAGTKWQSKAGCLKEESQEAVLSTVREDASRTLTNSRDRCIGRWRCSRHRKSPASKDMVTVARYSASRRCDQSAPGRRFATQPAMGSPR